MSGCKEQIVQTINYIDYFKYGHLKPPNRQAFIRFLVEICLCCMAGEAEKFNYPISEEDTLQLTKSNFLNDYPRRLLLLQVRFRMLFTSTFFESFLGDSNSSLYSSQSKELEESQLWLEDPLIEQDSSSHSESLSRSSKIQVPTFLSYAQVGSFSLGVGGQLSLSVFIASCTIIGS